MDGTFRAFTFVDKITAIEVGVSVQGYYKVPETIKEFPLSLAVEAVGQLAAWSAMARLDFQWRPVAGIAGRIDLLGEVKPGQTLELSAAIDTVDERGVSYGGFASVDGVPVIRMHHCLGPNMPMEDFDDPEALRERFAMLCKEGRTDGGFSGVPDLSFEIEPREESEALSATLVVPEQAEFFDDHFPRRPVFPGTLMMDRNLHLAVALWKKIHGATAMESWKIAAVTSVKIRSFTPPGEVLQMSAVVKESDETSAVIQIEARNSRRLVVGSKLILQKESAT